MLDTPVLLPLTVILATPLVVVFVNALSVSLFVRFVSKLIIVPSVTLLP